MNLKPNVLIGIFGYGLETPTPVQKIAINPINEGKDTILQAQNGMGKTVCFLTGAFNQVDTWLDQTQIIIVAPSNELCWHLYNVTRAFS